MDFPLGLAWLLHYRTKQRNAAGWHCHPQLAQSQLLDSTLTFTFLFFQWELGPESLCSGQPSPGLSGLDRGVPVILAYVHCGPRLFSDLPSLGR